MFKSNKLGLNWAKLSSNWAVIHFNQDLLHLFGIQKILMPPTLSPQLLPASLKHPLSNHLLLNYE